MTRSEPPRPEVGGPLDAVNDAFHELYDEARALAERAPPVIVVLADEIVLFREGRRRAFSYSPKLFHILKSAAHAPVALYAALLPSGEGALASDVLRKLGALRKHVAGALQNIEKDACNQALRDDMKTVLEGSLVVIDRALTQENITHGQREELGGFGPTLMRLIDAATRVQLASLHESASQAIAPLDDAERRTLQVVVTGDHQARVRSLGMQYFRRLLREPEGTEHRVTYAEGVADEEEARALVGTRRLDHALAKTFFGDPKRLQRDLLGDSAKKRLNELHLDPLG